MGENSVRMFVKSCGIFDPLRAGVRQNPLTGLVLSSRFDLGRYRKNGVESAPKQPTEYGNSNVMS